MGAELHDMSTAPRDGSQILVRKGDTWQVCHYSQHRSGWVYTGGAWVEDARVIDGKRADELAWTHLPGRRH